LCYEGYREAVVVGSVSIAVSVQMQCLVMYVAFVVVVYGVVVESE
jgi:hypothetical protein